MTHAIPRNSSDVSYNEAPFCEVKHCRNRAVGLIEDHYGVSWAVCERHAKSEGATREGGNPGAPSGIAPAPSRPGEARDGRSPQGRTPSAATAPPRELIDPDGEGIYLHEDQGFPGVLMRAALLFFNDMREWRNVEQRTVWMRPSEDGETWREVGLGRFPFGWKLWLPRRLQPVPFIYCTPNPEAL